MHQKVKTNFSRQIIYLSLFENFMAEKRMKNCGKFLSKDEKEMLIKKSCSTPSLLLLNEKRKKLFFNAKFCGVLIGNYKTL